MEGRVPVPPPCALVFLAPQRPGARGAEAGCGPPPHLSPASAPGALSASGVRAAHPVLGLGEQGGALWWRLAALQAPSAAGEEPGPALTSSPGSCAGKGPSFSRSSLVSGLYARKPPSSAGSETGSPHTSEMFPLDSALTSSRGSGPSWRPERGWAWHPHTVREGVSGRVAPVHVTCQPGLPVQRTRLKGV